MVVSSRRSGNNLYLKEKNHNAEVDEMSGLAHCLRMLCADAQGAVHCTLCSDGTLANSENGITFYVLTATSETQNSLHFYFC